MHCCKLFSTRVEQSSTPGNITASTTEMTTLFYDLLKMYSEES